MNRINLIYNETFVHSESARKLMMRLIHLPALFLLQYR